MSLPTQPAQWTHEGGSASAGKGGPNIRERRAHSIDGWFGVVLALLCVVAAIAVLASMPAGAVGSARSGRVAAAIVLFVVAFVLCISLTVVAPGQARVLQYFGRYIGTLRRPGLRLIIPLTTRRRISVRVRNFETNRIKVNDADGSPVEIAAIVVWQVADTARAVFAVDNYQNFVQVQAESALRHIASSHPYDAADDGVIALRGSTDEVAAELATEVAVGVALAGVEIVGVRISHLAYAQEIAQAMLRRQQANAVVAARTRIVEGAVGMVELALDRLSSQQIVDLDDERRAAMASNLMVVLCGEQATTPIVNTGSLYS